MFKMHTLTNYLYAIFLAALQFFVPIRELAIILILSVLIDTAFGLYRSYKLKVVITSHRLFINLVGKLGMYIGSLIGIYLIDRYLVGGKMFGIELFLSKAITLIYVFIEIKSIDESSVMCGNKSIWDIIEEMVKKGMRFKLDIKKLEETKTETDEK